MDGVRGWIEGYIRYFVLCDKDPDAFTAEDVIIVACAHGYQNLLFKMIAAYEELLDRHPNVTHFLKVDIDIKTNADLIVQYIPLMERGVEQHYVNSTCYSAKGLDMRISDREAHRIECHIECSVVSSCRWYEWIGDVPGKPGLCIFYDECESIVPGEHTLTRYYRLLDPVVDPVPGHKKKPFILGTILYNNTVQIGESVNEHWNDPRFVADLGLSVYPTYAEGPCYLFSAVIAKILVMLGPHLKTWAVEDSTMGAILAGLDFNFYQMPGEVLRYNRRKNYP